MGDYRDTKAEISGLIEEQIEKTPQATKSVVVLEASNVLFHYKNIYVLIDKEMTKVC